MIVKNEEQMLPKCLDSIKDVVDEIIIVDTGSNDKTKEIAYLYTDKVYDFEWINDFGAARNFSFSKTTKEYQLWLDADDILIEKDKIAFIELKQTLSPEIDMVLMKYNYVVDKKYNPLYSFYCERLLKRANNYRWNDPVHEYITYGDNYLKSEIAIAHTKQVSFSDRNLKIYEEQLLQKKPFSPRALYYYARELRAHHKYDMAIEYFTQFLNTKMGSVGDNINACLETGKIYKKRKDPDNALKCFFNSFCFDIPRAESCCEIGYIYKEKGDYKRAIYWFEFILTLKVSSDYAGITNSESWTFIPAIELAVCYYNIGNIEKALYYNELAESFNKNHNSVVYNRNFLDSLRHK